MKIPPPGLPEPLRDQNDETLTPMQSTWDALADTILDMSSADKRAYRRRVNWPRYSVTHWCCWRPMRLATIDVQPLTHTFGWTKWHRKYVACNRCGRIGDTF